MLMNEEQLMAAAAGEMSRCHPVILQLTANQAWMLAGALQLVLSHPGVASLESSNGFLRGILTHMRPALCVGPATTEMFESGMPERRQG
jgi:hypothetical protein